ncbi:MAG TPA: hypothetical protein VKW09_14660 [bacterium]|nr:hypothetical protein [bacterium]
MLIADGADHTVGTAAVRIHGKIRQVLTDANGMTLYYLATDAPVRSTCTGECARVWPPFISAAAVTSDGALRGRVRLVNTDNGSQVSYNGHLLYRYSGDTAPGQANGDGVGGRWWVADTELQAGASSGAVVAPGAVEHREGGGSESGMGGGMGGR